MNEKLSELILWIYGQIKTIPMRLPLYGGCLDCGCKVQVTGYMYSNIESNPNLLLMLTSFNFA